MWTLERMADAGLLKMSGWLISTFGTTQAIAIYLHSRFPGVSVATAQAAADLVLQTGRAGEQWLKDRLFPRLADIPLIRANIVTVDVVARGSPAVPPDGYDPRRDDVYKRIVITVPRTTSQAKLFRLIEERMKDLIGRQQDGVSPGGPLPEWTDNPKITLERPLLYGAR